MIIKTLTYISFDCLSYNCDDFLVSLKNRDDMTKCELNQIFLGEIASVQNYGAFIRIPGTPQQGLIHRSQVLLCSFDKIYINT